MVQIGLARSDITPPLFVPYLSYTPRQTPFQGVHDRLYVRALVADNGRETIALLVVDSLGYSRSVLGPGRDFVDELKAEIEHRTGIPQKNIMFAATHAHSTPQTTDIADLVGSFPEAMGWLEDQISIFAQTVALAKSNCRPAQLKGCVGNATGIAMCRRGNARTYHPRGTGEAIVPLDERVPTLLIEGDSWKGALFGFACHPVAVQVQPLVSADYPGVACELVERELGAQAMFVQGACGNINPVRGTSGFADVEVYGRILGEEVMRGLTSLSTDGTILESDVLASESQIVWVPRRTLPERGPFEQQRDKAAALMMGATDEAERKQAKISFATAREALRLLELGDGLMSCEVQVLRLGDALIVGLEGEPFVEYGLRIQEASPAPFTMVCGYANGYQGYIVTPEAYKQGGYEVSYGPWTRIGPEGGERILDCALALMKKVWK